MDGADRAVGAVERGVELFAGLARVDDQRREVFALVGNRAGQRFDVLERDGNALDVFFAQHLVQALDQPVGGVRSEEHTSELQSLMRSSYAVVCLHKKNTRQIEY